jgi:apolipoprotein N-acyltransferase
MSVAAELPIDAGPARSDRSRALAAAWRTLAAGASAALVVLCLPAADIGLLAWVALVPLLRACDGLPATRCAALGVVFGVVSSLGTFSWLIEVPVIGVPQMAVLAAYVSLYPALWCAALPRLARSRMPLVLAAPALWVALDALKANAGFLALPWGTLAHSQHENLALLQLASLTGEAGVSFVVVMVNVALAGALLARSRGLRSAAALRGVAIVVAVAHAGGALALREDTDAPQLTVSALQPGLPAGTVARFDDAHWQRLEAATRAAADAGAALIVWPETAIEDPTRRPALTRRLVELAQAADAALVVGAAEYAKFEAGDGRSVVPAAYNSAWWVDGAGLHGQAYRKRRLVPFAETVPLRDLLAWPRWLVPVTREARAGDRPQVWTDARGIAVAASICWDSAFAALTRDAVASGAQVIVQLTDDAWFGAGAAARQHNLQSVLRAVEHRTPVVLASNAGPAQVIDRNGRVLARAEAPGRSSWVHARVSARSMRSVYARFGNWFAWTCAGIALLACAVSKEHVPWK